MFYRLISLNSKRSRKEGALYFISMVIAIVSFYIILSLSHQDVMLFLRKMESDAVNRLFTIIPAFFIMSLFILFFLVYYVSRMEMDRRRHEFGLYLTLGMRPKKLFIMLLFEDMRNSLLALGVGLAAALMLSEFISLITAKVVGLGIIGHSFSLSKEAVLFTILGFLLVKISAFLLLSAKYAGKEPAELLHYQPSGLKKQHPRLAYVLSLVLGLIMLARAYHLGVSGRAWVSVMDMAQTLLLGFFGTIFLFWGLRVVIALFLRIGSSKKLHTYNIRQVEELVIHRSTSLAVCSLLIFAALCLFGAGVATSTIAGKGGSHVLDYTFQRFADSEEDADKAGVLGFLEEKGLNSKFSTIIEINIAYPEKHGTLDLTGLLEKLSKAENNKDLAHIIPNLEQMEDVYLISLSGYNEIRKAAGLELLNLGSDDAALYIGEEFLKDREAMNQVLRSRPKISLGGKELALNEEQQHLSIVTDSAITLYAALILPDQLFDKLTGGKHYSYISGVLKEELVKEKGLMRAMLEINEVFDEAGLVYESYLESIGRQLFFVIASSYITIYLALIFLIVSNTMIAVQFLMAQAGSYRRYQTLVHIGADYDSLCKSAAKQINWYFGLPIFIALVSSYFGVKSLFTGILPPIILLQFEERILLAAMTILLLGLVELLYITAVKRSSRRFIRKLMEPKREVY